MYTLLGAVRSTAYCPSSRSGSSSLISSVKVLRPRTLGIHHSFDTKMEAAAAGFISTPNFAVVGASADTSKFGYKLLVWYHNHTLPVTPINPRTTSIQVSSKSYATVTSVSELSNPSQTALSLVLPPPITLKVLQEAKAAGVNAVWLQPGAFDEEGLQYAKDNFRYMVGGYEPGSRGSAGWCVLVDGENALRAAGRSTKL